MSNGKQGQLKFTASYYEYLNKELIKRSAEIILWSTCEFLNLKKEPKQLREGKIN